MIPLLSSFCSYTVKYKTSFVDCINWNRTHRGTEYFLCVLYSSSLKQLFWISCSSKSFIPHTQFLFVLICIRVGRQQKDWTRDHKRRLPIEVSHCEIQIKCWWLLFTSLFVTQEGRVIWIFSKLHKHTWCIIILFYWLLP